MAFEVWKRKLVLRRSIFCQFIFAKNWSPCQFQTQRYLKFNGLLTFESNFEIYLILTQCSQYQTTSRIWEGDRSTTVELVKDVISRERSYTYSELSSFHHKNLPSSIFPMVVSILPHAELGLSDHQDAPHFIYTKKFLNSVMQNGIFPRLYRDIAGIQP